MLGETVFPLSEARRRRDARWAGHSNSTEVGWHGDTIYS